MRCNEGFGFGVVYPGHCQTLKADLAKLNVNGDALALGHPLDATGTKLRSTMGNQLERTGITIGAADYMQ